MKRLLLIFLPFFFISCNLNTDIHGWYVKNQTEKPIEIFFNNISYIANENEMSYFDDIPIDASVNISDDFHVNYESSYYYSTSDHHSKLLTIKDKIKYQYKILNNSAYDINFQNIIIFSGDTLDFTVYDTPADLHFIYNDFELPYTKNLKNNVYYIYITD